jgi:hypothetical protein
VRPDEQDGPHLRPQTTGGTVMVRLTCDRCDIELPEHYFEIFHYTVDEDGEDIEHGYDLCSLACVRAQVDLWVAEAAWNA